MPRTHNPPFSFTYTVTAVKYGFSYGAFLGRHTSLQVEKEVEQCVNGPSAVSQYGGILRDGLEEWPAASWRPLYPNGALSFGPKNSSTASWPNNSPKNRRSPLLCRDQWGYEIKERPRRDSRCSSMFTEVTPVGSNKKIFAMLKLAPLCWDCFKKFLYTQVITF